MSAAFTPGPWTRTQHAKFGETQMYWVNEATSVGTQVEGDINLIAAAPDLYAELEHARELLAIKGVFVDAIDNALAKARGEPA